MVLDVHRNHNYGLLGTGKVVVGGGGGGGGQGVSRVEMNSSSARSDP